jgi:hypothetical protein
MVIESIQDIKDVGKIANEILGQSVIRVKRYYTVMPRPCCLSKDRSSLYANPVNDFYDNALLESQDVLTDYARLCYSLNESIKGIDVSTLKIDEMFSNPFEFTTHNFHPLAVVRYAMDKGFAISQCLGTRRSDKPSCNRVKANGLWMKLPSMLESEIMDYFRNRNSSTIGYCPVCEDSILSQMDK